MKNRLKRNLIIVLLLLMSKNPAWAEVSTVITDTFLYSRPTAYSESVVSLNSGEQVKTLLRSGGWKKVETGHSKTGWVRSYQVRSGTIASTSSTEAKTSGGFLSGLASLSRRASSLFSSNRRKPSYQRTATIGVRGLSEEQIKNAKPDLAQLGLMESHRSSTKQAKRFARKGKLKTQRIDHMPKSDREQ